MQCPYCDAKLDDVAILTNVCSACHEVLGDISQTMRTLRLDHPAPLSELEIKASGSDAKTVISLPTNDDGATVFVDDFATEPMPQPTARVLTSRTFVSQSGEATDYEIINKIGEGGMGIVQQARQNSLNRIVAIKIMGGYKGVDAESHFMQEATVTGSLEHPNIVPIYDMGRNEDGQPFYTMKRINGTPWAKTLLEKGLMDNIEILLRICDAVAYAHSRGIIHRDIKPENVMIGEFGETLLMDWGLAAGMWDGAAAPRVRYEDAIAGTPAYMAPEMAKGEEDNIGFHSDIYLLGAVLYEIITFEQPHNGGSVRECLDNAAANRIVPPFLGEGKLPAKPWPRPRRTVSPPCTNCRRPSAPAFLASNCQLGPTTPANEPITTIHILTFSGPSAATARRWKPGTATRTPSAPWNSCHTNSRKRPSKTAICTWPSFCSNATTPTTASSCGASMNCARLNEQ